MRLLIFIIATFCVFGSIVTAGADLEDMETMNNVQDSIYDDEEFVDAVAWMHDLGMTRYDEVQEFRPHDLVTRQEAAKFFSEFSQNVLYTVINQMKYCSFDDLEQADPSLQNHILESCLLGLFRGSGGKFSPYKQLTKGQALAVLVRALEGYMDETTDMRWENYQERALELNLTKETTISAGANNVTRYEIALLLYRAGKAKNDEK